MSSPANAYDSYLDCAVITKLRVVYIIRVRFSEVVL